MNSLKNLAEGKCLVLAKIKNRRLFWNSLKECYDQGTQVLTDDDTYQDEEIIHKIINMCTKLFDEIDSTNPEVQMRLVGNTKPFGRCAVILKLSFVHTYIQADISMCIEPQKTDTKTGFTEGQDIYMFFSGNDPGIFSPETIKIVENGRLNQPCEYTVDINIASLPPFLTLQVDVDKDICSTCLEITLKFIEVFIMKRNLCDVFGLDPRTVNKLCLSAIRYLNPTNIFFEKSGRLETKQSKIKSEFSEIQETIHKKSLGYSSFSDNNKNVTLKDENFQKMCKYSDKRMLKTIIKELANPGNIVFRRAMRRFPGRHVAYALVEFLCGFGKCVQFGPVDIASLKGQCLNVQGMIDAIDIFHCTVLVAILHRVDCSDESTKYPLVVNALLDCLSILCIAYIHLSPTFDMGLDVNHASECLSLLLVSACTTLKTPVKSFSCFLYTDSTILYVVGTEQSLNIVNFQTGTNVNVELRNGTHDDTKTTKALSVIHKLLCSLNCMGMICEVSMIRSLIGNSKIFHAKKEKLHVFLFDEMKELGAFLKSLWGKTVDYLYSSITNKPIPADFEIAPPLYVDDISEGDEQMKMWNVLVSTTEMIAVATTCPLVKIDNTIKTFSSDIELTLTCKVETTVHCMRGANSISTDKHIYATVCTLAKYVECTRKEKVQIREVVSAFNDTSLMEFFGNGETEGAMCRLVAETNFNQRDHHRLTADHLDYSMKLQLSSKKMTRKKGKMPPMLIIDRLQRHVLSEWVPAWGKLTRHCTLSHTRVSRVAFGDIGCVLSVFVWVNPNKKMGSLGHYVNPEFRKETKEAITDQMDKTCAEVQISNPETFGKFALACFSSISLSLKLELWKNAGFTNSKMSEVTMGLFLAHPSSRTTLTITTTDMSVVCLPPTSVCDASTATSFARLVVSETDVKFVKSESVQVAIVQGLQAAVHVMTPTQLALEWGFTPLTSVVTGCPCVGSVCVNGFSPCTKAFTSMDKVLRLKHIRHILKIDKLKKEDTQYATIKYAPITIDVARGMRLLKSIRIRTCLLKMPLASSQTIQQTVSICLADHACIALLPSSVEEFPVETARRLRIGAEYTHNSEMFLFWDDKYISTGFENATARLWEVLDTSTLNSTKEEWKLAMKKMVMFRLMCLIVTTSRPSIFRPFAFVEVVDLRVKSDAIEAVTHLGPDDERKGRIIRSLFSINSTILTEDETEKKYLFFPSLLVDAIYKEYFFSVPCFIPGKLTDVVNFMDTYCDGMAEVLTETTLQRKVIKSAVANTISFLKTHLKVA